MALKQLHKKGWFGIGFCVSVGFGGGDGNGGSGCPCGGIGGNGGGGSGDDVCEGSVDVVDIGL